MTQDLDWARVTQRTNQESWGWNQKVVRQKSMAWELVGKDLTNGGWLFQFEREGIRSAFETFGRGLRTRLKGKRMNSG